MNPFSISLAAGRVAAMLFSASTVAAAGAAPSNTASSWVTAAVPVPRLEQRLFASAAARTNVSYFIYTPEVYDSAKEKRLPVLYWLHGTGGGLPGLRPLVNYFDAAIRAGKIPPMLIVFPNGLATSMWCDSQDGRVPMETVVVKELLPRVDTDFRTIATRAGRLIEGFSMGGYGAARLGFKYPELFAAVSLLAAGPLQEEFDPDTAPRGHPREARELMASVFGGDQDYFKAQSPWVLAGQNAGVLRHQTRVRQIIGDRDATLDNNRKFDARLTQLKIPHTFIVLPGVKHEAMPVLEALGESNLEFYRAVFGGLKSP